MEDDRCCQLAAPARVGFCSEKTKKREKKMAEILAEKTGYHVCTCRSS